MREDKRTELRKWKIKFRFRAKSLDFRFRFKHAPPSFLCHRLSILLKLRKCSFKLESQSDSASLLGKPRAKSKLRSIFRSLARFKVKTPSAHLLEPAVPADGRRLGSQEAIRAGSLYGCPFLALSYPLSEVNPREVIVRGAAAILCGVVIFLTRRKTPRWREYLLALVASTLMCSVALRHDDNLFDWSFFRSRYNRRDFFMQKVLLDSNGGIH